jgi:hypothetical protein
MFHTDTLNLYKLAVLLFYRRVWDDTAKNCKRQYTLQNSFDRGVAHSLVY